MMKMHTLLKPGKLYKQPLAFVFLIFYFGFLWGYNKKLAYIFLICPTALMKDVELSYK